MERRAVNARMVWAGAKDLQGLTYRHCLPVTLTASYCVAIWKMFEKKGAFRVL
ncbi:MAG: hypothetical protein ACLSHA_10805 [Neglectibacter timonensis]